MESAITDYITILTKENVLKNKSTLKGNPYFVMSENDTLNNDTDPDDKNVENFNHTPMYINQNTSLHLQKHSQDQYQHRLAMVVFTKYYNHSQNIWD